MPALSRLDDRALALRVARAREGDRCALEELVAALRDGVYNLALRMLWHPEDAEDATQEILIQVVTRLGGFRGEAAFTTWAYRVAANHLLTTRRRRAERALSFDAFAQDLAEGLADPRDHGVDERLLEQEVKIGCTHGMLLCLDREHRLAYILGEVFEIDSRQAAEITATTPAAYRKRLERARRRIVAFMAGHCGLVNPERPCRCARRIDRAIAVGRVAPDAPLFAARPQHSAVHRAVAEMDLLHDAAAVFRSNPDYAAPAARAAAVTELLRSTDLSLLRETDGGAGGPRERSACNLHEESSSG